MSKHKWDASLLRLVIQHLRVPELFYPFELGSADALVERESQTKAILQSCKLELSNYEETLLKQLQRLFEGKGSFTQANNLGFLIDRVFDVWLRKNQLPEQLEKRLSAWRFIFYKICLQIYCSKLDQADLKHKENCLDQFIDFLDSISHYSSCWNPLPKRSQSLLLDQLSILEKYLDNAQDFNEQLVDDCSQTWVNYLEKQNDKVEKITYRLSVSESKKNKTQYSLWLAYHYLNVLFNKRTLPQVLQDFLQEHWVFVLAKNIEDSLPEDLVTKDAIIISHFNEPLDTLCKNIVRVFCHKGESGFQLADQIIDDLQKLSKETIIPGNAFSSESFSSQSAFFSEEAAWEALSNALVSMLQDQDGDSIQAFKSISIPDHLFQTYGGTEQFKEPSLVFEDLRVSLNDWFVLKDSDGLANIKLSANFKQSHQLLFSNYLGMKSAQFSYSELQAKLSSGELIRKEKSISFKNVFEQAIKGLSKIADNQKKTRLIAAEKAKAEAERLLEDRRKSDELSNQRAEEIAQRTKQLLAKRADKQRLEKENSVLELIRAFKLGAWVAIHSNGESQRFKLVVKLAATGKYVFVDRHGVKKLEYLEAELMEALQSEKIEVLSDGAEFEDSLQRVVSRLRMSK